LTRNRPMWETSNNPPYFLVARCSWIIPGSYRRGMSQPPNSTMSPPWSLCQVLRIVSLMLTPYTGIYTRVYKPMRLFPLSKKPLEKQGSFGRIPKLPWPLPAEPSPLRWRSRTPPLDVYQRFFTYKQLDYGLFFEGSPLIGWQPSAHRIAIRFSREISPVTPLNAHLADGTLRVKASRCQEKNRPARDQYGHYPLQGGQGKW
jgi:hypothetical protein